MAKILKVKDGITWEEFKVKYRGLFRVSSASKAEAAMAEEFKRLTGRDPYEEQQPKTKRVNKPRPRPAAPSQAQDTPSVFQNGPDLAV